MRDRSGSRASRRSHQGIEPTGLHGLQILRVLHDEAKGLLHDVPIQLCGAECHQGGRPVQGLRDSRPFHEIVLRAHALDEYCDFLGELIPETRHFRAEDGDFLLPARIADVEVEAPAFQCVGELAGTIRGNDDVRYSLRANRPHLRDGDLEIGQELEEQALELFVGPVDLVDQKDGCLRTTVGQGLEERAFQEKFLAEDFPLQSLRVLPGLLDSNRDQLLRMVPFVQSRVRVEAFVALEADQFRFEGGRQGAGDLRLAASGFSFDEQGLAHADREVDGHANRRIGNVLLSCESLEDGVNAVDARFLRHEVPSVGTGLFVFNVWQNWRLLSAPPNDASGRRTSTVRSGSDMLWLPSDTATEPRPAPMDSSRFCLRNLLAALLPIHRRSGHGRATLLDLGVQMEDRVLLILLDGPEFVASFFGAMKLGAVPVPVNTLMRAADYRFFLDDSRAKVAIVSEPLLLEAGPALVQAKHLKHVVVVGEAKDPHLQFESWVSRAPRSLEAADTSKDDVAFWLYSSGSTGFPKGAVHLQHDMVVCSDTYGLHVLGITERDRTFSAAKLFFAYGLGNNMYFPMRVGAEAVLYSGRPTAEAVFQVVDRYRPTLFFGVPTLYASMLQLQDAGDRFDLSSLRLCVSAGEALPADVYRRWVNRFGVEILDGIGTTEILHIFLSNRPGHVKPGSSGTPVPGYEAIIVDEGGRPVPRGEIGNLRVKGDSTMAYYWNRDEKTKETLFGPWIQTGDKYYQDEDGDFWYCGRSDDMLKVGGIWVSPVEVENTLIAHEAVLEAAVVGQQDAEKLVKPKAYVVLKDPKDASQELAEELKEFVRNRIAPYKKPWWIDFVPSLPKTATGKIQRYRLRQGGAR